MINIIFGRILKDLRQKKLMPLKIIFFVQTSTLYILYPYLTIHMRELGINVEETAIMSAIIPFVAIIMPPIAGLIADRIGNFKILLSLFSALGGAASLLLLLVPIGRVTVQFPKDVVLGISCMDSGDIVHTMSQTHPCDTVLETRVNVTIQSCGFACPLNAGNETDLKNLLMSQNYRVSIYNPRKLQSETYDYRISESDLPKNIKLPLDAREHRQLVNMEYYKIAIRQLSTNVVFFPTHDPQLFSFNCNSSKGVMNITNCSFDGHIAQIANGVVSFEMNLNALRLTEMDIIENQRRYLLRGTDRSRLLESETEKLPQCSTPAGERIGVQADVVNESEVNGEARTYLESIVSDRCRRVCIATAPRQDICMNSKMQLEYNMKLTFWLYLIIRVFIGMIGGTSFAMFEGAVIAILREQKADYGLQRIYGSIGGMISSPLSGMLIDYASGNKGYADFRPAFYLYATLKIFSGVLMMLINLEFKAPASNVISDVVTVLKNVEIVALLTACFVLGTAWGYIESFLFWLLEDLGASRSLMGITITVGGIAGIPLLAMSGPIISKIGHANVIFIGFIFYAIRLLGYSLIYNPWLCLIFEALESVTSSLSFTAAVTYAAKLSTTTTDSSIQGLLGGLYYGVGKGSGSLIGGFLMKAFGTRPTYQIFAVVTLITGFIYLLFNMIFLSKRPQVEGNDIVQTKPKLPKQNTSLQQSAEADNGGFNLDNGVNRPPLPMKDAVGHEVHIQIVEGLNAVKSTKHLDTIEKSNGAEKRLGCEVWKRNLPQQNGILNEAFTKDEGDSYKQILENNGPKN